MQYVFFGVFIFAVLLFSSCESAEKTAEFKTIGGPTMGTHYSIVFEYDGEEEAVNQRTDSLLRALNNELSTYIEESTISRFNQSEDGIRLMENEADYFVDNVLISDEYFRLTGGLFDPTVMPLVNYWGFGFEGRVAPSRIDSAKVDSLLQYVGWHNLSIDSSGGAFSVKKEMREVQLDFSAVAKGYAVDILGKFLDGQDIDNYLIDIGGELCARGPGRRGAGWTIGVNTPDPTAAEDEITERFTIDRGCVATSGNYRNFREINGKIIGHTLNPNTGFPEESNVLSATVWHRTAAAADAVATAVMVAGYPLGFELVESLSGTEAFFIYIDDEGEIARTWTAGFEVFLPEE